MRRYGWIVILLVAVLGGGALVLLALDKPEQTTLEANVMSSDLDVPAIGFAQVADEYEWQFPQDFGPHPNYQREQWEIQSGEDCEFAFTVLFDRASFVAEAFAPQRESAWAMHSIMQGQFTFTDKQAEQNSATTLTSRVALGLAGADEQHVWLEDWAFNWTNGTLMAAGEDARLELTLTFGDEAIPAIKDGWYAYRITGEGNGQVQYGEQSQDVACPISLIHRFQ
ncbi:MAG: hypothetical protein HY862_04325 [Chloroflexi bacterium]|nr:hypothetical protein [Chloroflexota bacterium]